MSLFYFTDDISCLFYIYRKNNQSEEQTITMTGQLWNWNKEISRVQSIFAWQEDVQ